MFTMGKLLVHAAPDRLHFDQRSSPLHTSCQHSFEGRVLQVSFMDIAYDLANHICGGIHEKCSFFALMG